MDEKKEDLLEVSDEVIIKRYKDVPTLNDLKSLGIEIGGQRWKDSEKGEYRENEKGVEVLVCPFCKNFTRFHSSSYTSNPDDWMQNYEKWECDTCEALIHVPIREKHKEKIRFGIGTLIFGLPD